MFSNFCSPSVPVAVAARSSLATADAASFVVPAEIMRVLERVPCDGRDFERLATGLCQARHGRRIVPGSSLARPRQIRNTPSVPARHQSALTSTTASAMPRCQPTEAFDEGRQRHRQLALFPADREAPAPTSTRTIVAADALYEQLQLDRLALVWSEHQLRKRPVG